MRSRSWIIIGLIVILGVLVARCARPTSIGAPDLAVVPRAAEQAAEAVVEQVAVEEEVVAEPVAAEQPASQPAVAEQPASQPAAEQPAAGEQPAVVAAAEAPPAQPAAAAVAEAPPPTPTPTLPPPTEEPDPVVSAVVNVARLNVRKGPSTVYDILDVVSAGDELVITGKNENASWVQIETDEIGEGWVSAEFIQVDEAGLQEVAVAAAPPTPTPTPTPIADAVVTAQRLNVREGPSTNYKVLTTISAGDGLTVTGKNEDGSWIQIQREGIDKGWVYAGLVEVFVDLSGVEVAEAPPEPQPAPQVSVAGGPAPAPRGNVGFGYGIQAHMMNTDLNRVFDYINGMGFNWIKQQVEWFVIEPNKGQYNWGPLDAIVNTANARGVNVLFSVVKAPHWARPGNTDWSVEGPPANPQDFADFMGALAARYKGRVRAYEIWNEQNLGREWGNEPIDAGRYIQLLAAAYKAVKAQDPGAYVISGAPTPTGVNNAFAMDDALYLEKMYQAGLKNYCDGVGVHPSGYNNPPSASAGTWNDPTAPSFKGHRSFFFRDTLWTYYNIMKKYGDGGKRLWPTEFGWASVEGLGVAPAAGYGYAADNTQGEQAQFLVEAMQLARSWGFVGPMFVWNLNFAPIAGAHDEKAAFGILMPDWSPRPAYYALRDMPK